MLGVVVVSVQFVFSVVVMRFLLWRELDVRRFQNISGAGIRGEASREAKSPKGLCSSGMIAQKRSRAVSITDYFEKAPEAVC